MKRLVRICAVLLVLLVVACAAVYVFVPQIQPCALLSRILPVWLLPPNPNIRDLAFAPLPGARAITGECACSGYRIEVPEHWNGDLVVYAHGFRNAQPDLTVTNLPVRKAAIEQGFAWAASSYRANGFNPQDGVQDTLLLIDQFKKKVGDPKHIFIYGSSMGGFVVVDSLERYGGIYAGGVSECGITGGAEELDYLVSLNALADALAGVDLFAVENKGLKVQMNLLRDKVYPALGEPPDYTFDENGLNGSPLPPPIMTLTPQGRIFRDAQINLGGGPRPFAKEGFAAAYKLIFEPARVLYGLLPGGAVAAGTNVDTQYRIDPATGANSAEINASVRRVAADPAQRARFVLSGRLQAPLLAIYDTGDLFVPLSNALSYRQRVDAAGRGNELVQRSVRRFLHCDFSDAERERAFNDLIRWVRSGVQPDGENLSGSLLDAGRTWTEPLRPDDPGHP
jgi:pimeloyl-ACP methyl ester carboxylesterase